MTERVHDFMPSPIGALLLISDGSGLTGLYMEPHEGFTDRGRRDASALKQAREQVLAYFAGELREFDLSLRSAGTVFQQRVWSALREIPYGETISYGELARRIDQPAASRAVGLANGRNPISIVVPCHRVIGSNGALTGYGGGVERKRWLLDHESRNRPFFLL